MKETPWNSGFMASSSDTIDRARRRFHAGRFHAAADLLLIAFREDPTDVGVARELGVVLHASGDPQAARTYLSRAHFADPADPTTLAHLVVVLHELGQHDEASRVLVRSLAAGLPGELLVQHLQAA